MSRICCRLSRLSGFLNCPCGRFSTSIGRGGPTSDTIPARHGVDDLPGVRIAYDLAGHGTPVIFLHGGLLDRRMWDDQFSVFARHHLAIRYDMRSAGQSETAHSTAPYSHHVDLYHLLQALQFQQVTLVGFSNYAIALDFAIAYPALVQKLVLVSPGLRGYEFRDPWVSTHLAAMLRALGRLDLAGAVEVFLTMWVDGPNRAPAQVDPVVRERVRGMVAQAFPLSRLAPNVVGLEPPAIGRLAELRAPTLIVLGDQDALDIHAIGKLIHNRVRDSILVMIPEGGHTLVMEKPAEFNTVVDEFLQG
jgi:3-oxoadipate enol-lactonase